MSSVLTHPPALDGTDLPAPATLTARTARVVADGASPARSRRRALRPAEASPPVDVVEQWGLHSFPASDPPANW